MCGFSVHLLHIHWLVLSPDEEILRIPFPHNRNKYPSRWERIQKERVYWNSLGRILVNFFSVPVPKPIQLNGSEQQADTYTGISNKTFSITVKAFSVDKKPPSSMSANGCRYIIFKSLAQYLIYSCLFYVRLLCLLCGPRNFVPMVWITMKTKTIA